MVTDMHKIAAKARATSGQLVNAPAPNRTGVPFGPADETFGKFLINKFIALEQDPNNVVNHQFVFW
jgi:hypothetical protein